VDSRRSSAANGSRIILTIRMANMILLVSWLKKSRFNSVFRS
jgi:DNA-binding transcriptional regulator of glucitol operon